MDDLWSDFRDSIKADLKPESSFLLSSINARIVLSLSRRFYVLSFAYLFGMEIDL